MEEENEILDEFQTDEQRLQEAKDHEFAIQLSQEEMSDDKDEYASFFIKPSTAFEGNCTASVSSVFDEQKQRKKSDVVPVEGNIITLMEMSFTHEQAFKALKMTDNNMERAVDWIFAHPGDMGGDEADEASADNDTNEANDKANLTNGSPKYKLVAFISHMGTSHMVGHYVCHILKEGKWVIYNDAKVALSQNPPKGLGYLYLYQRISSS